jgi:hypothetical protein
MTQSPQEVPELQAAVAEVRRVAELVKNTQPIWRGNLLAKEQR